MERTDHQVTCDRCKASEPRRYAGGLPVGWEWLVLSGPRSRLLCEACQKDVLAFIDRQKVQP